MNEKNKERRGSAHARGSVYPTTQKYIIVVSEIAMVNAQLYMFALAPMLTRSAFSFAPLWHPTRTATEKKTTTAAFPADREDKKKRDGGGGGFGKSGGGSSSTSSPPPAAAVRREDTRRTPLKSVDYAPRGDSVDVDAVDLEGMSPEERSRTILRSKFGLKSYEEQQADRGDYRALMDAESKREKRDRLRNYESLWPEDKDLLGVLPPNVIRGIDAILKFGLATSTLLFVVAGIFISIEAGSKATGNPLPGGLEAFVVDVVEPNFTPGLGVLLAFSVSLGLFSVSLGGSASSTYREDR